RHTRIAPIFRHLMARLDRQATQRILLEQKIDFAAEGADDNLMLFGKHLLNNLPVDEFKAAISILWQRDKLFELLDCVGTCLGMLQRHIMSFSTLALIIPKNKRRLCAASIRV